MKCFLKINDNNRSEALSTAQRTGSHRRKKPRRQKLGFIAPSQEQRRRRADRSSIRRMGGKKGANDGLGRTLIKQHNQMVRDAKEKGRALHLQQRRVLESVTDVSDIDAILEKAAEADRVYSFDNPSANVLINMCVFLLLMVQILNELVLFVSSARYKSLINVNFF